MKLAVTLQGPLSRICAIRASSIYMSLQHVLNWSEASFSMTAVSGRGEIHPQDAHSAEPRRSWSLYVHNLALQPRRWHF